MEPFTLIGVPIDSVGRRGGGTEHSPAMLRELDLSGAIGGDDRGDLPVRIRGDERDPETGILGSQDVLASTAMIRAAIAEAISHGERPFLAGGCCAELPGALAGARDALGDIGLVHVDGHLDLYDGVTSPTGEAADMPVAVALGRGPERWVEMAGGASVAPERAAIVGYRDREESIGYGMAQPEEIGAALTHCPVDRVRAEGPGAVGERTAAKLAETAPFWLHFDVDVLDQEVFPATDYLMPGGLSWEELVGLLTPLLASQALIGTSLACYNPEKDPDQAHGRALVDALSAATPQRA